MSLVLLAKQTLKDMGQKKDVERLSAMDTYSKLLTSYITSAASMVLNFQQLFVCLAMLDLLSE